MSRHGDVEGPKMSVFHFFFFFFFAIFETDFLRYYQYMFLYFLGQVLREKNTLPSVSHLSFLEQPKVTVFVYFALDLKCSWNRSFESSPSYI